MSRKAKARKVAEIKHRSGVTIDLMFDPNEDCLEFSAQVGGRWFRGRDSDKVRQEVYQYVEDNAKLDWVPVIEIGETAPFQTREDTFIGLEIERYYLANTQSREIRFLEWEKYEATGMHHAEAQTDAGRVKDSSEFHAWHLPVRESLPHSIKHSDKQMHWIAYDESAWLALNRIAEGIGQLKEKIRELVGTKDGRERLVAFGEQMQRMLPAPKEEEES